VGKILTGTASWTDPGFIADWYPKEVPATRRLQWYAQHFNLVEVNSTFYRLPDKSVTRGWAKETPDGFLFDIKLHRLFSRHSTKPEMLPPDLRGKVELAKKRVILTRPLEKLFLDRFLRGLEPLEDADKLGALLLQLSPGFSPRSHDLKELDHLVELLQGYSLAVELRNRSWVTGERLAETKKYFISRKLTFVMVDGPDDPHFTILPPIDLVSNRRLAYLRAHGRNVSGYIRGRSVAERFDHDYSNKELKQIAQRVVKVTAPVREVHVIYNNNKSDFAPRAAAGFQKILHEHYPQALPAAIEHKELAYA
jgi:uncharacterized protein YecE (DUF72 family)